MTLIVNIGTRVDKFEAWLSNQLPLIDLFGDRIYAGKPAKTMDGKTMYFNLVSNSSLVSNDYTYKATFKRAIFDFVIISNDKDIPDVELFENLDTLSNTICGKKIVFDDNFKIFGIQEGDQTGVVNDEADNPLIVGQYYIDYKAEY